MSITTDLMDFPQKSDRSFFIRERGKGVKTCMTLTFIESITDFGRKRFKPLSLSNSSKFDFLSKATWGMSLKKRLKKMEVSKNVKNI